ncbi:NHLP leader peptide family RiPP precursor [Microseira wollei]|uniref:Nitrile hydratase-like protein n=1 Tax=Microseira wollei NIES-4236 TaxID=2530354 RepID=A0AAV3XA17_9CYAN|nr:NHLP leader peptide family RiPP precursor [Microseira wollei]GET37481.1 nitrile hydratase-like protein [Microseira wollei NIES-4236]
MNKPRSTRQEIEERIIAKSWQDDAFKQEILNNPKAVLSREIGQPLPEDVEIRVVEETPNIVYLVLPMKPITPEADAEISEAELDAVAGGIACNPWLRTVQHSFLMVPMGTCVRCPR